MYSRICNRPQSKIRYNLQSTIYNLQSTIEYTIDDVHWLKTSRLESCGRANAPSVFRMVAFAKARL